MEKTNVITRGGLFDMPDHMFKRFEIRLSARTITGGVFPGDPKQTGPPTTDFTVAFAGFAIQTPEEAADFKRIFDCKHVVSVRFKKCATNGKEVDVFPHQAKSLPLSALINDFSTVVVTCRPGAWELSCLNSADGELPAVLVNISCFAPYILLQICAAILLVGVTIANTHKNRSDTQGAFELAVMTAWMAVGVLVYSVFCMISDVCTAYMIPTSRPPPENFFPKYMWAGLKASANAHLFSNKDK